MSRAIDGTIRFRREDPNKGFSGEKLIKALEGAYLEQKRPNKFTKKQTFSPSSIGYGHAVCPRYWYLAFDGAPFVETNDAKSVAVMDSGTAAHSRLQKSLRLAGVLADEEVEVKMTDPPIRGYMDVLINMDGEYVVGEIKTTSEQIFTLKQVSNKPSPNHLYQILIYMKATGRKKGFLMYENRNDLSILVMEIDFNEKNEAILEQALDWMRLVHKAWTDRELPKRPYRNQTVKICQNCPLNAHCWEVIPEGDVKLPKMEVPPVT